MRPHDVNILKGGKTGKTKTVYIYISTYIHAFKYMYMCVYVYMCPYTSLTPLKPNVAKMVCGGDSCPMARYLWHSEAEKMHQEQLSRYGGYLGFWGLGFWGFRVLGFRVLGFGVSGFRV